MQALSVWELLDGLIVWFDLNPFALFESKFEEYKFTFMEFTSMEFTGFSGLMFDEFLYHNYPPELSSF